MRILDPAPVNSQNAVIACECNEIALPRILLRDFWPMIRRTTMTAGLKGPNLDTFPIVHFAVCGRATWQTAAPANGVRRAATGVAAMKADTGAIVVCRVDVMLIDCRCVLDDGERINVGTQGTMLYRDIGSGNKAVE